MNLNYVKEFLKVRRDTISAEDVDKLVSEINEYQGIEKGMTDISKVMRVIHEYNISFLSAVEEYEAIPKDNLKMLPVRMEKARDILSTLSALSTYLILSVASIKESVYDTKNIRGYLLDLGEKKEHYKSEKMSWVTILKSLTQEADFASEMRRLDIEDKVGYVKYKDN